MDGLRFVKMQGLGNDFVVLDGRGGALGLTPGAVRALADRRVGVGCDQVIALDRPDRPEADVAMRIFNADGGAAEACGNAARCVALLLAEEQGRPDVAIDTVGGLLACVVAGPDAVTVSLPPARFDWADVPLARPVSTDPLPIAYGAFSGGVALSVGNPHAVFFVDEEALEAIATFGPRIGADPLFPEGVNVGAARALDRGRLRLRVWERGAGLTGACGTGACAAAAAAHRRGLTDARVAVLQDGGSLEIEIANDGRIRMTGPARRVFSGVVDGRPL